MRIHTSLTSYHGGARIAFWVHRHITAGAEMYRWFFVESPWEVQMSEETITKVMAIEEQATQMADQAKKEASDLTAQVKKAINAMREEILDEARLAAKQIESNGQKDADAERAEILSKADTQIEHMETLAEQHFDQAIQFVLNQVTGCK